jgi:hypothetical protein
MVGESAIEHGINRAGIEPDRRGEILDGLIIHLFLGVAPGAVAVDERQRRRIQLLGCGGVVEDNRGIPFARAQLRVGSPVQVHAFVVTDHVI